MKKLFVTIVALSLMLVGCGEASDSTNSQPSTSEASVESTSESSADESEISVSVEEPESSTPENSELEESDAPKESDAEATDGFELFKSALDEKGFTYETTVMAADLVGAERGEKYTLEFGTVELYRFADNAEPLSTGEVTLEGFGTFPITISGNYGAIINVTDHADEITIIFKELQ